MLGRIETPELRARKLLCGMTFVPDSNSHSTGSVRSPNSCGHAANSVAKHARPVARGRPVYVRAGFGGRNGTSGGQNSRSGD